MDDCRQISEWITPYTDGTLPADQRAAVDQHVTGCPSCRDGLTRERGARAVLQRYGPSLQGQLPPGLRSRCEALAHEALAREHRSSSGVTVGWRTRWAPAGIVAALLVVTMIVVLPVATRRSDAVLAAQLVADHAKCFNTLSHATPELAARDAEMALARDGWDIHVPPSLPDAGLRLVGVRQCLYADGHVPHVLYEADGQPVSLFRLDGVARPAVSLASLGQDCRIWPRENATFVLVAARGVGARLDQITRYFEREAR